MGITNWRPMEGFTGEIPKFQHLLAKLKLWERQGIGLNIWRAFINKLDRKGQINWSECFMDGSFVPAKKRGGAQVGKTKRGKSSKLMVVADGQGIPLGMSLHSARLKE